MVSRFGVYYLLDGGKLIGDCGFRVVESDPAQAEIGATLAPEFQGKGYASEALRALLNYLFTTLKKHRVFGPSIRVTPRRSSCRSGWACVRKRTS